MLLRLREQDWHPSEYLALCCLEKSREALLPAVKYLDTTAACRPDERFRCLSSDADTPSSYASLPTPDDYSPTLCSLPALRARAKTGRPAPEARRQESASVC